MPLRELGGGTDCLIGFNPPTSRRDIRTDGEAPLAGGPRLARRHAREPARVIAIACERRPIALFEAALDLPEAERDALVEREAGEDGELAARIRSMLAANARAGMRTGAAMASFKPEVRPERVCS